MEVPEGIIELKPIREPKTNGINKDLYYVVMPHCIKKQGNKCALFGGKDESHNCTYQLCPTVQDIFNICMGGKKCI